MKKPQTIRKSAFLTLERLEDRSLPAVVLPLPGADYADVQPLPSDNPVPFTSGDTILTMPASSGNTGGPPSQPSGVLAHPEYLPIESPYDHVLWQNRPGRLLAHPEYLPIESPYDHVLWQHRPGRLLAHPEYLPIESPYDHISWRPGRPVLVSPVSVRPLTLLQSPAVSLFSRIQLTIQRWIQDAVQPKQDHQVLTELDQAIRKLEEIKKAGDAGDASQEAIDKAKLAKTVLEEYEKVRSNADAAVAAAEAAVRENNTRANREARDKALADAKKRIQEAERVIISRARYFENTYRIDEVLRNHNVEQSMREEILRTLEQSADRIDPKTKEPVGRPDDRDFRKAAEKVYPRTEKKEQDALFREMRDAWPRK